MTTKGDFPSIGERLRAALSSYQKGIGVDYELKATRARGHQSFPILDDLGFELLALLEDRSRMDELQDLVAELRANRLSLRRESPPSSHQ